jgi:hypothetical protein
MKIAQIKLIKISANGSVNLVNSLLLSPKQIKVYPQSLKNLEFFQKSKKSNSSKTLLNISYRSKYKI